MTDKMRDDAIREAARNNAGDEYFNADRAYLLVSPYSGRIFDAGFDRGWQAAQSAAVPVVGKHPSHVTRASDASSFDEICINCGAKDIAGAGWGDLANPCNQSVPVVGDVVGWILLHEDGGKNLTFHDNTGELADGWTQRPLIIQPATSISAAELDALRKDAERYRWLQKQSSYLLKKLQQASMTDSGDVTYFHADKFDAAIDAAIAQGKGE